jgi:taurine dioxygenase
MQTTTALESRRITAAIGAVLEGLDLRRPLAAEEIRVVRQSLLEHGVVFFRGQDLSDARMHAFVSHFGTPIPEPFAGPGIQSQEPVGRWDLGKTKRATSVWHSDTTFVEAPPGLTALRAVKLPPVGGDTCWASMSAAYDALSEPFRRMLDGLTAVHSMVPTLMRMGVFAGERGATNAQLHGAERVHPVITVHPETGRKVIFVSEAWTTRIVELEPAESAHVLALLFEHVKSPDFSMRWRWTPNDVALWDNRTVQHYAVPDYQGERVMQRVVLAGDRPQAPGDVGL